MSTSGPSPAAERALKFRAIVMNADSDGLTEEGEERKPEEVVFTAHRNELQLRVRLSTMFNTYGPCLCLALDSDFTKPYWNHATLSSDATGVTTLYCRLRPVKQSDLLDILRFHAFAHDSDGLTRARREFAALPLTGFHGALQNALYDQLAMSAQLLMTDVSDEEFVAWQCEAVRLLITAAGARVLSGLDGIVSPIAFLINKCAADDTVPALPLLQLLLDAEIAENVARLLDSESHIPTEDSFDLYDDVVRIDPSIGRTPLHTCVKLGAHDAVRMILDAVGPDGARRVLQVQCTVKNDSPLHAAVDRADVEMVKLLCEFGVDVTLRDMLGNTPLEIAEQRLDSEIIDVLLAARRRTAHENTGMSCSRSITTVRCLPVSARSTGGHALLKEVRCLQSPSFLHFRKASSCSTVLPSSPRYAPRSKRIPSFPVPIAIQNPTSTKLPQSSSTNIWKKKVSFCWALSCREEECN